MTSATVPDPPTQEKSDPPQVQYAPLEHSQASVCTVARAARPSARCVARRERAKQKETYCSERAGSLTRGTGGLSPGCRCRLSSDRRGSEQKRSDSNGCAVEEVVSEHGGSVRREETRTWW